MNRLIHLLRSQTAYNLHSPYLYRLYTQVVAPHRRDFSALTFALREWSSAHHADISATEARLIGPDGELLLLRSPHSSAESEARLARLYDHYPVSLDLYHTILLIRNPKLHPQRFLLR